MLFSSENTLQPHTKLTVLFWVSIKFFTIRGSKSTHEDIFLGGIWSHLKNGYFDFFHSKYMRTNLKKNHFLKTQSELNIDLKKVGLTKEPPRGCRSLTHSLQAPAGRRLEPLTAAAALAPAQCSHRALITCLHGVQMDPLQAYVPNVKGSVRLHSTISFPHPVPFYKEEPDLFFFLLPYVHL